METHQKYHMCTLCEKVFIGRAGLRKHLMKEHSISDKCDNLFICHTCHREFESSVTLNGHYIIGTTVSH